MRLPICTFLIVRPVGSLNPVTLVFVVHTFIIRQEFTYMVMLTLVSQQSLLLLGITAAACWIPNLDYSNHRFQCMCLKSLQSLILGQLSFPNNAYSSISDLLSSGIEDIFVTNRKFTIRSQISLFITESGWYTPLTFRSWGTRLNNSPALTAN